MKNKGFISRSLILLYLVTANTYSANQGTNINITATVIGPPPCTLPSSMEVRFNNVDIDKIQGMNIREKINYSLKCTSNAKFSLKILGGNVDFDQGVLKTDKQNLGIKIYAANKAWDINTPLAINSLSELPLLEAVLVRKTNQPLSAGQFTSNATLIVEQN